MSVCINPADIASAVEDIIASHKRGDPNAAWSAAVLIDLVQDSARAGTNRFPTTTLLLVSNLIGIADADFLAKINPIARFALGKPGRCAEAVS